MYNFSYREVLERENYVLCERVNLVTRKVIWCMIDRDTNGIAAWFDPENGQVTVEGDKYDQVGRTPMFVFRKKTMEIK